MVGVYAQGLSLMFVASGIHAADTPGNPSFPKG
jgi:hypothetical protein